MRRDAARGIGQAGRRLGRAAVAFAAAAFLATALAGPAGATSWQLEGRLGHHLFYGTAAEDLLQHELRYRLALRVRPEWDGQMYLSVEGGAGLSSVKPSPFFEAPPEDAWPELDEAYVDLYLPMADLRLGRQVVAWGTADGFNPTDVINPRASSLGSLTTGEVRRLPVPAVRVGIYAWPRLTVTAVGVTDFVPAPLPEAVLRDRVARAVPGLADPGLVLEEPQGSDRYELGLRGEMTLGAWDLYLSYFNGVEDWPALWVALTSDSTVQVQGRYRRQQHVGLALAGSVEGVGLWAEAAYVVPEEVPELETGPLTPLSDNEPRWEAIVGADYRWGDLHVSGQLMGLQRRRLLSPYREPGVEGDGLYAIGLVRHSPPLGSTTWELVTLASLRDGSAVVAPGVSHEIRPGLQLSARYLAVVGDGGTELGALRDGVEGLATRLTWSF